MLSTREKAPRGLAHARDDKQQDGDQNSATGEQNPPVVTHDEDEENEKELKTAERSKRATARQLKPRALPRFLLRGKLFLPNGK